MKSIFDSPGLPQFMGNNLWMITSTVRTSTATPHTPEAVCQTVDNLYKVGLPLPGFKRENIKIEVFQQNLSIKAERPGTALQSQQSIDEQFTVHFTIDPEKISATFVDGFLIVTMEKPDSHTPKTVTIQSK